MLPQTPFRPLGDRILIRRDKAPEKTKGGIFLPEGAVDKASRRTERGEVLAVGPGAAIPFDPNRSASQPIPLPVKAGDRVLFAPWSGHEIAGENPDELLLICKAEDILAVIE